MNYTHLNHLYCTYGMIGNSMYVMIDGSDLIIFEHSVTPSYKHVRLVKAVSSRPMLTFTVILYTILISLLGADL